LKGVHIEKLRIGIIGFGEIVRRAHAEAIKNNSDICELAAICDLDEEVLKEVGEEHKVPTTTDYHELCSCKDLDAVLIATPTSSHGEITGEAFRGGKHVLCEKPMALTLEGCDRMLQARDEASKILQIAFMQRNDVGWNRIKEIVDSQEIGQIHFCSLSQHWWGEHKDQWRSAEEISGGGILADSACHWLDLIRWFIGEPKELVCYLSTRNLKEHPIDDSAAIMLKFKTGAVGVIRVSWGSLRPYDQFEEGEFYGNKGSIVANMRSPWSADSEQTIRVGYVNGGHRFEEFKVKGAVTRYTRQIKEFVESCRRGWTKLSGEDGRRAQELQLLCYQSAATGKTAKVPPRQ